MSRRVRLVRLVLDAFELFNLDGRQGGEEEHVQRTTAQRLVGGPELRAGERFSELGGERRGGSEDEGRAMA